MWAKQKNNRELRHGQTTKAAGDLAQSHTAPRHDRFEDLQPLQKAKTDGRAYRASACKVISHSMKDEHGSVSVVDTH